MWWFWEGSEKLAWTNSKVLYFDTSKQAILDSTCCTPGADVSLTVDASATRVGVCLQRNLPGFASWQPLMFFSKKLEVAQQKYSAFVRELFACYAGIRHFRFMLEGCCFNIFTHHEPLPTPSAGRSGFTSCILQQ